jgi:DNA-binding Lrp family transcriptional regulator
MEELGIIKQYRAILSPEMLNLGTAAFVLASVSYRAKTDDTPVSQREVSSYQRQRNVEH